MGVNGLMGLINSDDRFLIKNFLLYNVKLVIDANNLAGALLERVKYQDRTDRVGVNLVAYGKQVELFFDNLRKCKVEPILVFDGAQTNDVITSKISKKTKRIEEHIENVEKLIWLQDSYYGHTYPIVHPACTNMILKAIAIEKQVKVAQCFYEADQYVAKMANDYDGFVLSDDTDFFIFDVKRGVISTRTLNFEDVREQNSKDRSGEKIEPHSYIECDLFSQSHFLKAFPGLDKSCLPLFASIAGNDIGGGRFDFLLFLISRNLASSKRDRLRILLEFLCNKSLEQNIDSLLARVKANKRENEALIRDCIKYYDLPEEDDFDKEISKHYRYAFYQKYRRNSEVGSLGDVVEREMRQLAHWLRKRIENSNLSKNCLELALRNTCLLRPEIDDITKPSARVCINRYRSVLLALMRSSHKDNQPCSFYDRGGYLLKMFEVKPLLELNYGSIDHLIYDVCDDLSDDIVTTKLPQSDKTAILLATFHSSPAEFLNSVSQYEEFLEPQHRGEFAVLKLLIKYVELEEAATFELRFRKSFLMTYLYYLHYGYSEIKVNIADDANESYLGFLDNLKQLTRVNRLEDLNQWTITDYDITIVRNILQMQTAIKAYEELNAFLGTTLPTLRMHKWFNSSLIYNFAVLIERRNLQLPSIINDQ